jgi:hypothetical protein
MGLAFHELPLRKVLSFSHFHPFCYGGLEMVWDFNKFSTDYYLMSMKGSKLLAFTLAFQFMLQKTFTVYFIMFGRDY